MLRYYCPNALFSCVVNVQYLQIQVPRFKSGFRLRLSEAAGRKKIINFQSTGNNLKGRKEEYQNDLTVAVLDRLAR
jgi:hypothetical protein